MKIRMTRSTITSTGPRSVGERVELPDAEAIMLIGMGKAERAVPLPPPPPSPKSEPVPDSMVLDLEDVHGKPRESGRHRRK